VSRACQQQVSRLPPAELDRLQAPDAEQLRGDAAFVFHVVNPPVILCRDPCVTAAVSL
jgi:hypothetical protein